MEVRDTIFFLEAVYKDKAAPEDKVYQGSLSPKEAWTVRQMRVAREKMSLQNRLLDLQRELEKYNDDRAELIRRTIESASPSRGWKVRLNRMGATLNCSWAVTR